VDEDREGTMKKTITLLTLSALLFALYLPAEAQQPKKLARIGFLSGSYQSGGYLVEPLSHALRQLGYVDLKDFVVEMRGSAGDDTMLATRASELVNLKVDVIVTDTTAAALAAKSATAMIPIVAVADDPVGSGLVGSLARPGGNVTGLSIVRTELNSKRLELVKEALPRVSRAAVLWAYPLTAESAGLKELQTAARALGVKLSSLGGRRINEYDAALAAAVREHIGAILFIGGNPLGAPYERQIVDLARIHRLPAMYDRKEYAEAGGLMTYGPSFPDLSRRAAVYVDKILKGTKPADLPVEQPTKFEFIVNLKAAKQIGLTIPPNVLARADKVIK
jgi:putative tryptophan/tyrosine transport system substrate-binding protein